MTPERVTEIRALLTGRKPRATPEEVKSIALELLEEIEGFKGMGSAQPRPVPDGRKEFEDWLATRPARTGPPPKR